MVYFKRSELTHGRDKDYPLTPQQEDNLKALTEALNKVREAYGYPMVVSSCYRPAAINTAVGGAKKSNHMECLAADIADKDGKFAAWVMDNLDKMESFGIKGIEDPKFTNGWVHLQIVPVKSGKLVFIP